MIEVERLTKTYDNRIAVHDLSFRLEAGQVLGLIGPNGAGKTTTLRALCGIHPPSRGTVRIAGHDIVRDPVGAKQRLGFVPDDPQLFPSLSVWEHLEFIAKVYGVAGFEVAAGEILERFELDDRRDTLADELSRGMRQKVAVACALLHRPDVLLLDEPMTGLDPRGQRTLADAIRRSAESGAAVIVSSHQLAQVDQSCSRFLILVDGRCRFDGDRAAVRAELPEMREDASLEEIFFELVEGPAPKATDQ